MKSRSELNESIMTIISKINMYKKKKIENDIY